MPKRKPKPEPPRLHLYTVVGFYYENLQPYVTHVKEASVEAALKKAMFKNKIGDLVIVDIFPGHIESLGEHDRCLDRSEVNAL